MADYNIYIHNVTGGNDAPTTPFQLKDGAGEGAAGGEGASGGGFGFVKRAASFVTNPDSAVGTVMNTASGGLKSMGEGAGAIGIAAIAIAAALTITHKLLQINLAYSTPASGDYKYKIDYDNIVQAFNNGFHPISTYFASRQAQLNNKIQNVKAEQEQLLTGGTIYDSRYGRYL